MTRFKLIEMTYEAREIHILWELIQTQRKKEGLQLIPNVGNAKWHRRWTEYYDELLKILK